MKPRVFGEETEYGCAFISNDGLSYVPSDSHLLNMLQDIHKCRDYAANGALVYLDSHHIEYATPECLSPLDVVAHSKAGELILSNAARKSTACRDDETRSVLRGRVRFFRHNVDAVEETLQRTFGCHENYSFEPRKILHNGAKKSLKNLVEGISQPSKNHGALQMIASNILPFLMTRYIWAGNGSLAIKDGRCSFQLSQRIPHMKKLDGIQTTGDRCVFNWRDEPLAENLGRLHVVCGDANMSEYQTYLKYGTMGLVLGMIEDGYQFDHLELLDPFNAFRCMNNTLNFHERYPLKHMNALSALDIQRKYLCAAQQWIRSHPEEHLNEVIPVWDETLLMLEENDPALERRLDWAAKRALLKRSQEKGEEDCFQQINLQYHDIDPEKSIYHALVENGMMDTLLVREDVTHAVSSPPKGSRAVTRKAIIDRIEFYRRRGFHVCVNEISWDHISYAHQKRGMLYSDIIHLPTPYDTTTDALQQIDYFMAGGPMRDFTFSLRRLFSRLVKR